MIKMSEQIEASKIYKGNLVANTTVFLFDSGTFFVAHTDNNSIRVGMNHLRSFDIPKSHALYNSLLAVTSESDVEFIFDSLMDMYR